VHGDDVHAGCRRCQRSHLGGRHDNVRILPGPGCSYLYRQIKLLDDAADLGNILPHRETEQLEPVVRISLRRLQGGSQYVDGCGLLSGHATVLWPPGPEHSGEGREATRGLRGRFALGDGD